MKQILIDGRIVIRTIQIYIFNLRKTKQAPITDACCRDSRIYLSVPSELQRYNKTGIHTIANA